MINVCFLRFFLKNDRTILGEYTIYHVAKIHFFFFFLSKICAKKLYIFHALYLRLKTKPIVVKIISNIK